MPERQEVGASTRAARGLQTGTRARQFQEAAQGGHVQQQTRLVKRVSKHWRCASGRVELRHHPASIRAARHDQQRAQTCCHPSPRLRLLVAAGARPALHLLQERRFREVLHDALYRPSPKA